MELNAETVKKALECCTIGDCYPCPYGNIGAGCRDKMNGDALTLIFELTEKSNNFEQAYDCMHSACRELSSKCDRLTEENEVWQMQLISQEEKAGKAYYELACEVEDLRAENEKLAHSCTKLTQNLHECKTDTVRKMQERLHSRKVSYGNITFRVVSIDEIDQIAKEMLEGDNEASGGE